ncbi:MAG: hypothetical protein Q8880_13655, partial [Bacteroidota bacterium]|nr:hypothetical protein [Bacteroidota bacterium]
RTNTNRLPAAFGGTPPFTTCADLPNAGYAAGSSVPYFYDIYHKFYCGGSFKNKGTVKFISDQIVLPNFSILTPEAAVTLRFYGYSHDTLDCNGITDLYNLIVDKGPDQTYNLTVNPTAYTNFRIFGMNACAGNDKNYTDKGNPEIDRAIWIKNGTLRLTGNTVIPSLSEGNGGAGPRGGSNLPRSDFFIPRNGCLLLDGPNVIVLVTADEYREVNVAFGFAPGANSDAAYGITESNGSSLSLYGKFQINSGYISTRESDGIQFWPNASGVFEADGGIIDAKQLCDGQKKGLDISTININGGTIHLRGGYRRDEYSHSYTVNTISDVVNKPILYDNNFYNRNFLMTGSGTFNVDQKTDAFTMSGGEVHIYDICNTTASQRAIEINCDPPKAQITGGRLNKHTDRQGKT